MQAIRELLQYLDANLLALHTHLLDACFQCALDSMWVEVLEEVRDVITVDKQVHKTHINTLSSKQVTRTADVTRCGVAELSQVLFSPVRRS